MCHRAMQISVELVEFRAVHQVADREHTTTGKHPEKITERRLAASEVGCRVETKHHIHRLVRQGQVRGVGCQACETRVGVFCSIHSQHLICKIEFYDQLGVRIFRQQVRHENANARARDSAGDDVGRNLAFVLRIARSARLCVRPCRALGLKCEPIAFSVVRLPSVDQGKGAALSCRASARLLV